MNQSDSRSSELTPRGSALPTPAIMNSVLLNLSVFALLSIVSVSQAAQDSTCSAFVNQKVCSKKDQSVEIDKLLGVSCSAQYEGFSAIQPKIRQYINAQIIDSYQLTLLSTNFGNHKANRPGFEALYKKLSDEAWEDAIELIKYNAKRGGKLVDFSDIRGRDLKSMVDEQKKSAITEYNSLATAVDLQKELAAGAHDIHKEAIRLGQAYHDPEISSFIEKEFVHKYSSNIRTLAGYLADMNSIMSEYTENGGPSLSLYLFDEYLQKSLGVAAA
ncbi:hypothetical protein M8J75_008152 [Diaphorina citri]|nr:hypothetical protein M8J75_008152 [Diaphorina citri]